MTDVLKYIFPARCYLLFIMNPEKQKPSDSGLMVETWSLLWSIQRVRIYDLTVSGMMVFSFLFYKVVLAKLISQPGLIKI